MESKREQLLIRQEIISQAIHKIGINFAKDSSNRKTVSYLKSRLDSLQALWDEFQINNTVLLKSAEELTEEYFTTEAYEKVKADYLQTKKKLENHPPYKGTSPDTGSGYHEFEETGVMSKTDELKVQQNTNFRAFSRFIRLLDMNSISEKWEIEDKLQTLQLRWKVIDDVHWKIDNLLVGADVNYELDFTKHEETYESTKRDLNRKLNSTIQQYESSPKIEIPVFSGNYTQWPTFLDLYSEAIHNNTMIPKARKMQHLKGKLKGEAERLVQHLTVSAENYDSCWEILNHRYNNIQLLFTKQMQLFMDQPAVQQQNAHDLKRLHDTSLEAVHAIHNLGINTDTWDPILIHLLMTKLDTQTYLDYMESRNAPRELPILEEFLHFLETKFTALESVTTKKKQTSTSSNPPTKEFNTKSAPQKDYYSKYKRHAFKAYHASFERSCPICRENHILQYCKEFQEMSPDTKMRTIGHLNICENCMYSHENNKCNSYKRCKVCKRAHHTKLHDVIRDASSQTKPPPCDLPSNAPVTKPPMSQRKANHVSSDTTEVLLATMQLKIKSADGNHVILRCLLDQGSQINLITESAAQRLGLQRHKQNSTMSGISMTAHHSRGTVNLSCESLYGDYAFSTEALVMANILNNLPNYSFEKQPWPHVKNINLADPEYNISRKVDVLLDAGVYADIIMNGLRRGPTHQAPIAQQTKVGWILLGNMKTFNCHVLVNTEDFSRFWEIEEVTDTTATSVTPEEEYCETLYTETTKRLTDGRYAVKIPMKQGFSQNLGTSKPQAVAQFKNLEKRLAKDENLAASYKSFITEYLNLGHMKHCKTPAEPSCYLPHHGVLRLQSTTTKLRVVFNASAKTSTGQSLNHVMERGLNLQQDLQAMILRWRVFKYVYTADIEKFYRQIMIQEEDQHLQKIVWRDSAAARLKDYQLCTVTYGTKAAPFLAMRTIKQLITDDGSQYPLAAKLLDNQLYVDDLLGGSNDIATAQEAQGQLINLLKGGGFKLRKWASNSSELLKHFDGDIISQKMLHFTDAKINTTLGIAWNPCTDQFTFKQTPLSDKRDVNTKRTLLSDLSRLYDPLGWLSPVTIKAKLIFQQAWITKTEWDDPLPENIQQDWEKFRGELPSIHNITISRWIGDTHHHIELHGFCDASEKAYGCVIYCKSRDEKGLPIIQLVAGKTKLAPLKKSISLPRLELCAAVLLSRLMRKVTELINAQTAHVYGWTDSMVVLGWLQGDINRWKAFVSNRVATITKTMQPACWRHVKSEENAADCASRGLCPSQIQKLTLWWEGPSWLKTDTLPNIGSFTTTEEEKRQKLVCATQINTTLVDELLQTHSSMTHATRVLSWIMRFINNAKNVMQAKRTSHLTTLDIKLASDTIVRTVQRSVFAEDIEHLQKHNKLRSTSKLLTLNPVLDKEGILRVGGRLEHANLQESRKHPQILPSRHRMTELLIDQAHKNTLHGGARLTLTHLRHKYWILGGMKTVKAKIGKCVTCHRFKTQNQSQLMANLPKPRVTQTRPFACTGVDFTGSVEVKANKGRGIRTMKAYIAIFVCLCTKAIHLELVSDLSTAAFLAALKRLCGRRGTPTHIYSDNGTNFVGAARVLAKTRQEALKFFVNADLISHISEWGIEWHFNAPSWPTAGGLWEAAVKSMKHHLKRVIGEQKLTFEEFTTLLIQIEACLNSRPLLAITNDPDDLDCLMTGHFLIGAPVLAPPISTEDNEIGLTMRWRLTEQMHKQFWKKWSHDYLQTLQVRGKWHHPTQNMAVGDVVLVKEENLPPARWLLGRVTETHPGPDGRVRVVSLKTKSSTLKRPITKLSRLPLDEKSIPDSQEVQKDGSKPRRMSLRPRIAKNCAFTNYLSTLFVLAVMCVTQTTQQLVKITSLDPTRLVYFDKIADMQVVQDEWKMVIFYNMTTYWKSVENIEKYVNHLQHLCSQNSALQTISSQFEHELRELKHYNQVLRSEHGPRTRRGLINGVGYLANSLFGVLDERFAEKYNQDIQLLQANGNHVLKLYKEHTSIIEGEYNLLKRNEQVMNQQFQAISKHLEESEQRVSLVQNTNLNITSNAIAAHMILGNLRRVQQLLLDLITDVRSGKINAPLIRPDEFESQLNTISGQVPKGLSLPCMNSNRCVREMYKLSRVHVRLIQYFLLFEVKIPLVADEQYELTRVIPIPNINGGKMTHVVPTSDYLAINLRKDMLIQLSQQDLSSCVHSNQHLLLCTLKAPIYAIKTTNSFCEAQIINNRPAATCKTEIAACGEDWIKLQDDGAWLFTCCEECSTRIFCPDGAATQNLNLTGVLSLEHGCMLRGDHHVIHSQYNLHSEVKFDNENVVYVPQSSVNDLLTIYNNITRLDTPETPEEQLKNLKQRIESVKVQQEIITQNTEQDTHNYVLYGLVTICGVALCIALCYKTKGRCITGIRVKPLTTHSTNEHIEMQEIAIQSDTENPTAKPRTTRVDNSTSPIVFSAISDDIQ